MRLLALGCAWTRFCCGERIAGGSVERRVVGMAAAGGVPVLLLVIATRG